MSWWRRVLGADRTPSADPASTEVDAGFGVPEDLPREDLPGEVAEAAQTHRLVLLTRQGCHLCDDVTAVINQIVRDGDLADDQRTSLDIDDHPQTRARFTTDVPVVIVDGRIVARWRVDASELRGTLAQGNGAQRNGRRGWA